MIKYTLICKDCNKEFESWFGSSKEYDRLKKMKILNCQNCSSLNVEKSLMAPNLSKTKKSSEKNEFKLKEVKQKLKEYKKFVFQFQTHLWLKLQSLVRIQIGEGLQWRLEKPR